MASYTPNLNLVLPIGVEKVSRAIVNSNNTIIDGAIGGINTKITPVSLGASTLAGVKTALINLNSGMTNYTDRAVYFALSSTDGVFTANVPYIGVLHRQDANNFSCNVQGKSGQNITLGYDNGTWTIDSPKDEVATLNSKMAGHVNFSEVNAKIVSTVTWPAAGNSVEVGFDFTGTGIDESKIKYLLYAAIGINPAGIVMCAAQRRSSNNGHWYAYIKSDNAQTVVADTSVVVGVLWR